MDLCKLEIPGRNDLRKKQLGAQSLALRLHIHVIVIDPAHLEVHVPDELVLICIYLYTYSGGIGSRNNHPNTGNIRRRNSPAEIDDIPNGIIRSVQDRLGVPELDIDPGK